MDSLGLTPLRNMDRNVYVMRYSTYFGIIIPSVEKLYLIQSNIILIFVENMYSII